MIDSSVTQAGIPYLVTQYIDGVPITQYASEQQLDICARARLLLSVCRVRHRGGGVTTVALVLAIFVALGLALWQAHIARQLAAAIDALHASLLAFEKKYGAEYSKKSITRASDGAASAASGDSVNGEAELRHAIKS